jgi:hypothetical protein
VARWCWNEPEPARESFHASEEAGCQTRDPAHGGERAGTECEARGDSARERSVAWGARVTPRVEIQVHAGEAWETLVREGEPVDDEGLDVVTVAGAPHGGALCWCAYWRVATDLNAARTVRIAVTRAGERRSCVHAGDCSPGFSPASGVVYATCADAGG